MKTVSFEDVVYEVQVKRNFGKSNICDFLLCGDGEEEENKGIWS